MRLPSFFLSGNARLLSETEYHLGILAIQPGLDFFSFSCKDALSSKPPHPQSNRITGGSTVPLVTLMVDPKRVGVTSVITVVHHLSNIVAKHLAVPVPASFPSSEVSVEVKYLRNPVAEATGLWCMSDPVQVKIEANNYPERYEIRDQLADAIARDVKTLLPGDVTCWVWLCLQDAGFAKA